MWTSVLKWIGSTLRMVPFLRSLVHSGTQWLWHIDASGGSTEVSSRCPISRKNNVENSVTCGAHLWILMTYEPLSWFPFFSTLALLDPLAISAKLHLDATVHQLPHTLHSRWTLEAQQPEATTTASTGARPLQEHQNQAPATLSGQTSAETDDVAATGRHVHLRLALGAPKMLKDVAENNPLDKVIRCY